MVGFDTLKECSKCGSDACYTKEVSASVTIEWCFGCGFVTNNLLRRGEAYFNEQMEILPEINKALMVEEEGGKIWMPSFTHVEEKGMVYANGVGSGSWAWEAVKTIKISSKEQKKLKTESKYKADQTTMKKIGRAHV